MSDSAAYYNKHGLRLFCAGHHQEAIDFFTKAIEMDPLYSDAYLHRGMVLLETDHLARGNADIQKAKDLRSGNFKKNCNGRYSKDNAEKPARINWQEIECIYDTVMQMQYHDPEDETIDSDDLDASIFLDEIDVSAGGLEDDGPHRPQAPYHGPAILELVNGKCIEVARMRLFEPTDNDVSLLRQDGHVERVIPMQNIACIRNVEMSFRRNDTRYAPGQTETVETVNGNIYRLTVAPDQERENVLFGISAGEQDPFIYTFIPVANIMRRCQDRYLGEILLEKGFIADEILQQALAEYRQAKVMKLGKIIAMKTNVGHSAIEEKLGPAKASGRKRTGEILSSCGLIEEQQLAEALQYQEQLQKMKIGQFLIDKGIVKEEEVYMALAEQFSMPFVDLRTRKVSSKTLGLIPADFIRENGILPISLDNGKLTVAALHPETATLRKAIMAVYPCDEVRFVLSRPSHLRTVIDRLTKDQVTSEPGGPAEQVQSGS